MNQIGERLKIKSKCCNKDVQPDGENRTILCSGCHEDLGHDPYNEEKMIISKAYEF